MWSLYLIYAQPSINLSPVAQPPPQRLFTRPVEASPPGLRDLRARHPRRPAIPSPVGPLPGDLQHQGRGLRHLLLLSGPRGDGQVRGGRRSHGATSIRKDIYV